MNQPLSRSQIISIGRDMDAWQQRRRAKGFASSAFDLAATHVRCMLNADLRPPSAIPAFRNYISVLEAEAITSSCASLVER